MAKVFTSLDGPSWTKSSARVGFPILVEYALARRPITYEEWDREIVRRGLGTHVFLTNYGRPAGAIGDACEEFAKHAKSQVPTLNLMVVNQYGIPGKGADYYIEQFSQKFLKRTVEPQRLSTREKKAIIQRAHEAIFAFPEWTSVLDAFGLEPTEKTKNNAAGARLPRPNPGRWHYGPESDAHKTLKQLVAQTPGLVNLSKDERGNEEYLLWSGDEIDVYFRESATGVEVKTRGATRDELHRGIFQCVKYKAVLQAQQIHDQIIPTADCVLGVGGKLPDDLQEIATRLQVRFFQNLDA